MDVLDYKYERDTKTGRLKTNRLRQVADAVGGSAGDFDLAAGQIAENYRYDQIGNMIGDNQSGINNIDWSVYGKIRLIDKGGNANIAYSYDPSGNRVSKTSNNLNTYYVRDAQGNNLAVYDNEGGNIHWQEQTLYGSSRLGMWRPSINLAVADGTSEWGTYGKKFFELSNHLGNVLSVISDNRDFNGSEFLPFAVSGNDYYAFGGQMPGRGFNSSNYRYGFNGKENDNEVKGAGNQQDYGMRIYDPRIGKFLSVDPVTGVFPFYSSYQYAGNSPIRHIDLDGLEKANPSVFTKAWNYIDGQYQLNRLNDYLTENKLTSENVITLVNDTYVVVQVQKSAELGTSKTLYSIFRRSKKGEWLMTSSKNDDIGLTENEFLQTEVLGNKVIDVALPAGAAAKGTQIAMAGSRNAAFTWRKIIGTVQAGAKELQNWSSEMRIGVLDALGTSKDLIKKGIHFHFEKLGNLELTLKPMAGGKMGLGFISGNRKLAKDAVKLFNRAMENQGFRDKLLVSLKSAQETLNDAAKTLTNVSEAKMAGDKAHEINYLIDAVKKYK